VRVVAGNLRGRPILAPEGEGTRPTADRARQAVFNILEHAPWSDGLGGRRVLDLFAGSGAMGLEALSRGAAACVFVDNSEPAVAAIRANVSAFGLGDRARVVKRDAATLGQRAPTEQPFDLAFLDPPYRSGLGERALAALLDGGWLAADALIVLERGATEPPVDPPSFERIDERRYGAAAISLLRPASPGGLRSQPERPG
jgi:16S rRNA (guanine966-N2)-methyltransferase